MAVQAGLLDSGRGDLRVADRVRRAHLHGDHVEEGLVIGIGVQRFDGWSFCLFDLRVLDFLVLGFREPALGFLSLDGCNRELGHRCGIRGLR